MDKTTSSFNPLPDALGAPWGNFDYTRGILPVSELEGHLEAFEGRQDLLEVSSEEWAAIETLPIALL